MAFNLEEFINPTPKINLDIPPEEILNLMVRKSDVVYVNYKEVLLSIFKFDDFYYVHNSQNSKKADLCYEEVLEILKVSKPVRQCTLDGVEYLIEETN